MKKSANQIIFNGLLTTEGEESKVESSDKSQIEFLPCLFQSNVDESNKAIYFDSILREADNAHIPRGMSNVPCKCSTHLNCLT